MAACMLRLSESLRARRIDIQPATCDGPTEYNFPSPRRCSDCMEQLPHHTRSSCASVDSFLVMRMEGVLLS
jgi:hypothetical protein